MDTIKCAYRIVLRLDGKEYSTPTQYKSRDVCYYTMWKIYLEDIIASIKSSDSKIAKELIPRLTLIKVHFAATPSTIEFRLSQVTPDHFINTHLYELVPNKLYLEEVFVYVSEV